MQLVIHEGGQRDGDVAWVPEEELATLLVYSGPRYLGVYRQSSPMQQQWTESGHAQVWVAVQ